VEAQAVKHLGIVLHTRAGMGLFTLFRFDFRAGYHLPTSFVFGRLVMALSMLTGGGPALWRKQGTCIHSQKQKKLARS